MVGKLLISIALALWFAGPARGEEEPAVGWGIQTVVSNSIPGRHNMFRRAVLSWGETCPHLEVEVIDFTKGAGSQVLLLRQRIDIEGGLKVCPDPAESWCGEIGFLLWKDSELHLSFQTKGEKYSCVTTISEKLSVSTACELSKP